MASRIDIPNVAVVVNGGATSPAPFLSELWVLERVVVPSVIAFAFAFLVAHLIQRHVALRELRTQLFQRCLGHLTALEEQCAAYWLRNREPNDQVIEEKIEATLIEFIDLRLQCHSEKIIAAESDDVPSNEQLIETLTGGTFRSQTRTLNVDNARAINQALNAVRKSFFEARRTRLRQQFASS